MKTATFKYTDKTDIDSSLGTAVYYDAAGEYMAIEFHTGGSAFYGEVPEAFYKGFVTLDSIGKTYNSYVKNRFPEVSDGTVYNVNYVDANATVADQTNRYMVKGYVRHQGTFTAGSQEDARQLFLDSLSNDGYDGSDLAVTEVYILE